MKEKIYEYIKNYYEKHKYMPSVREILEGVQELSSLSTVHYHIQKLINEGKLETDHPGCPRAYRFPKSNVNY